MRLLPVLLASILLSGLSACGGEGEPEAEPTPTAQTSGPNDGEASRPPEEPAESEVLDPCAAVPEKQWQSLLPARDRDRAVVTREFTRFPLNILVRDERERYACVVEVKGAELFYQWGFFTEPMQPRDLAAMLEKSGGTQVSGVDYYAYTAGDLSASNAFAIDGTTGLFVSIEEQADSVVTGERASDRVLVAMLKSLEKNTSGVAPSDVMLPSFCPAADSPEVRRVMGRIPYARGGLDAEAGHDWCVYWRPDQAFFTGVELRLEVNHLEDEVFDDFYDETSTNPNGVDLFDAPPGLIRMVSTGEDGSGNTVVLDPDSDVFVNVTLDYREETPQRRRIDEDAFTELARSFAEERSAYHSSH